jgi:hypothetical protein
MTTQYKLFIKYPNRLSPFLNPPNQELSGFLCVFIFKLRAAARAFPQLVNENQVIVFSECLHDRPEHDGGTPISMNNHHLFLVWVRFIHSNLESSHIVTFLVYYDIIDFEVVIGDT